MSIIAHNLYKVLAKYLIGFEKCTVPTIYRNFLENGAKIKIKDTKVIVSMKKKTHLPILLEVPWIKEEQKISWLGISIKFEAGNTI